MATNLAAVEVESPAQPEAQPGIRKVVPIELAFGA